MTGYVVQLSDRSDRFGQFGLQCDLTGFYASHASQTDSGYKPETFCVETFVPKPNKYTSNRPTPAECYDL